MAGGLGAIFGPIAAMSGLAANSRASGQRQAQLDAIEQLKAQGLIQDQQAKQFDLQDAIEQHAARAKLMNDPNLPQEVKDALAAGASPADALKMRSQGSKAKVFAQLLNAKASNATPQQLQKMLADAVAQNPDLQGDTDLTKIVGIGEKSGRPFQLVDKTSGAPVYYSGEGPVPPNAVPEQVYASQHKEGQRARYQLVSDGKGGVVRVNLDDPSDIMPVPGAAKSAPKDAGGRKPLTPAAINAITKQIDNEWALQPTSLSPSDLLSGDRKRQFYSQRKTAILFGMGYNQFGQPFKDGETVKDPTSGKVLTWRDS